MHRTRPEVSAYMKEHAEFGAIGGRMLQEWETGAASLRN